MGAGVTAHAIVLVGEGHQGVAASHLAEDGASAGRHLTIAVLVVIHPLVMEFKAGVGTDAICETTTKYEINCCNILVLIGLGKKKSSVILVHVMTIGCLGPGLDGAALYIAVKRGHLDSIFAPACSIRLNETWRSISYLLLSLYYLCVYFPPNIIS